MNNHETWKKHFQTWPKSLPHKGVLVTTWDETISFVGFMTGPDLLAVERQAPDTTGARKVILAYGNIAAVKLVAVVEERVLSDSGFTGQLVK